MAPYRRKKRRFSRRSRKPYTRRTYMRRKRRYARKPRILSIRAPTMPDKIRLNFRYFTNTILTTSSAASVIDRWDFRANSLYDPDLTYTGHQPLCFDQWTTFYAMYRVTGARMTVKCTKVGGDGVGFLLRAGDVQYTTLQSYNLQENLGKMWSRFDPDKGSLTLRANFSARKLWGTKMYDMDYCSSVTTNPLEQAFFQLFYIDLSGGVSTTFALDVKIEFHAEMWDKYRMAGS